MRKAATVVLVCVAVAVAVGGAGDVAAAPDTTALIRPGVGIGKVRLA